MDSEERKREKVVGAIIIVNNFEDINRKTQYRAPSISSSC
jgi:hypothetical protein